MSETDPSLWKNIVLSTREPICVFDHDFRLIAFNQAHNDEFFRVNGHYTKLGDVFPDLFVPEQGAVMRRLMARALAGEAFTAFEDFGNPVLGTPYWELTYTPVRDDDGAIIGAYHHAVDISARLAAEAERRTLAHQVAERTSELMESRARLRTIFETSLGFQTLLTKAGILTDANATALAAIGARIAAIVGRPYAATPWFAETPGLPEMIARAVGDCAAGATVRQEVLLNLPVGGWRWFDLTMRPIRGEDGAVAAIAAEAIETTDRRHAEEALRQAQKLEAMGQLTGGVAHDFNNLLTPIIGTLDLLQRNGLGSERERRLIEGGLQAADRARTLVQRLLAFARRQPLQSRAVDIGALVAGMADTVTRTLGLGIRIVIETGAGVAPARADPNQLQSAILNLCVNAADAMPDGGTLTLSVASETIASGHAARLGPGRYVRLTVADTGIGMSAETLGRAIEPFYSTKGIGKGAGLGLSMVHGLAAQLGGGLELESAPGLGTRVHLWLPENVERSLAAAPPARDRPAIGRGAGTALLVDDEDIVRATTADMLAELGYAVTEARNAGEALDILARGAAIDLLLTDHLMPGMTGAELARIVRRKQPELPVLLISGFAEVDAIAQDIPHLTKPFRHAQLAERLRSLARSG